ncbi:zinc dependent phospholipase C family protein [Paratractidigestivibacter sp.]|uniref:zinc dependent phospholipase C family protein n=1 Tax=Paratractidigestivibacter sp. TaxID=2847316 RepID=UPI002ABE92E5|nr:zinc dependent phospholipase C family protein [Paratractidigestivibacter sp.]
MPAIICHHIFGEDAATALPAGMLDGEEELLAFLLGNQGPDPLFARFLTLPSLARADHRLGHEMHDTSCEQALIAFRSGVSHLPAADERVGRAFVLGLLAHYCLDSVTHPFVFAQQAALAAADPSLAGSAPELHAVIESDIDSWILFEKRGADVLERPAHTNLMRTERICRVAGALFSQVAYQIYGMSINPEEYGRCVADYELKYRLLDPAGAPRARTVGALERIVRVHSFAEAMAHRVVSSSECPAANLEGRAWANPADGRKRHESFADLFDAAQVSYPVLAEAFSRGAFGVSLDYNGMPLA